MKKAFVTPAAAFHVSRGNHWIFSGAIASAPPHALCGEIVSVHSPNDELLGYAFYNSACSLALQMVSFGANEPFYAIEMALLRAAKLRKMFFADDTTNCYRLINSEGDGLPGLIVDRYGPLLVVQIGTAGMENIKGFIVEQLKKLLPQCQAIYEKSTLPSRIQEGLEKKEGFLTAPLQMPIRVIENGLQFLIDCVQGQKTGFFLDQREMRAYIRTLSSQKRVLNCFSYTGGFSIAAAAGGAISVDSIDTSQSALEKAKEHFCINNLSSIEHRFICEDVKDHLAKNPLDTYDCIILDPPAFAKKKFDRKAALKAYETLFSIAFAKAKQGAFVLVCSCSRFISQEDFDSICAQAAKRPVQLLLRHRMAQDHTVALAHLEAEYLKSSLFCIQ